jgi:hypothetical protein
MRYARRVIESYVDLTYRGVSLGRRIKLTQVRPSSGYLELPAPMPVGTHVAVATDDGVTFDATVTWVHEQVAGSERVPGMVVAPELAVEAAASWWRARVALADEDPTKLRRTRPVTARPRPQSRSTPPAQKTVTDRMPAVIADLEARVTAAARVEPPAQATPAGTTAGAVPWVSAGALAASGDAIVSAAPVASGGPAGHAVAAESDASRESAAPASAAPASETPATEAPESDLPAESDMLTTRAMAAASEPAEASDVLATRAMAAAGEPPAESDMLATRAMAAASEPPEASNMPAESDMPAESAAPTAPTEGDTLVAGDTLAMAAAPPAADAPAATDTLDDPRLEPPVTLSDLEPVMRRTGEHEVVDDGKHTMIMDSVDPAAIGLEAGASGEIALSRAGDLGEPLAIGGAAGASDPADPADSTSSDDDAIAASATDPGLGIVQDMTPPEAATGDDAGPGRDGEAGEPGSPGDGDKPPPRRGWFRRRTKR